MAALRHLSDSSLREALARDRGPFEYLLSDDELAATMSRRDFALAYIDELIAKHGEDAVLAFP